METLWEVAEGAEGQNVELLSGFASLEGINLIWQQSTLLLHFLQQSSAVPCENSENAD